MVCQVVFSRCFLVMCLLKGIGAVLPVVRQKMRMEATGASLRNGWEHKGKYAGYIYMCPCICISPCLYLSLLLALCSSFGSDLDRGSLVVLQSWERLVGLRGRGGDGGPNRFLQGGSAAASLAPSRPLLKSSSIPTATSWAPAAERAKPVWPCDSGGRWCRRRAHHPRGACPHLGSRRSAEGRSWLPMTPRKHNTHNKMSGKILNPNCIL